MTNKAAYLILPYQWIEGILNKLSFLQRLLFVLLLSLGFLSSFFAKTLLAPADYTFAGKGDDFKNYYTLKTYIDQSINTDLIHYNSMNYPFRDVVYYSDNSPLLSVPIKFIYLHTGWHINPIGLFNYLVIFNFILATLMCYFLLSKFIQSKVLIIILSISLPYFNPQAQRLAMGTENLSLSFILIANLFLLYKIYESTESGKTPRIWNLLNLVLIILSSFLHLYYLIILCLNTGLLLFIYGIYRLAISKDCVKTLLTSVIVPGAAFATVLTFFLITDEFYNSRNGTAMGYNIYSWKTNFLGFFKPYDYMHLRFIVEPNQWVDMEAHTYFGSFVLFGLVIASMVTLIRKIGVNNDQNYSRPPLQSRYLILLLIASAFSLFIALGPEYEILDGTYRFHNYFNLFNLFMLFTDKVTHFRCLGRFSWLFFWAINFSFAHWLDQWVLRKPAIAIMTVYLLSFMAIKDMADCGAEFRYNQADNQFAAKNMPTDVLRINKVLGTFKYDAILPLPFFLVGSEIHDRTIDPVNNEYFDFYCQLSSLSKLPLMSSQLSRTPIASNESLFNLFLNCQLDTALGSRLRGKTIAVIKNDDDYNLGSGQPPLDKDTLKNAFFNSATLPESFGMTLADTVGKYYIYKWRP